MALSNVVLFICEVFDWTLLLLPRDDAFVFESYVP